MSGELVLHFNDERVTLGLAGGKGINLALLSRSDFQVPHGFIVTTDFYKKIVKLNKIDIFIKEIFSKDGKRNIDWLESKSQSIRSKFKDLEIDDGLFKPIEIAYKEIGAEAVAVRSSATAEDLEDLSFAGQHDTILNVVGIKALKKAIIDCISSLWTARAIGYREQNKIPHENLSLAVIVQVMIQSEISGVMFTVNPLTGNRYEYVIDSTFGLGEALVSGLIEPDHYIINSTNRRIVKKSLGSKKIAIKGVDGGGIKEINENLETEESLSLNNINHLIDLGNKITDFYKYPQDIEWAFMDKELYLLQSRSVTTLFPVSEKFLNGPKRIAFSFAAVQGFSDPMTPLGRDTVMLTLLSIPRIMSYNLDFNTQTVFWVMAERIWINISYILKNRILKDRFILASGGIDRGIPLILKEIMKEKWLKTSKRPNLKAASIFTRLLLSMMNSMRKYNSDPKNVRKKNQEFIDQVVDRIRANSEEIDTLEKKIRYYFHVLKFLPGIVFLPIIPAIGVGYAPLFIANKLSKDLFEDSNSVLELTRSLPNNPTTIMNLELARTANLIKRNRETYDFFNDNDSENLTQLYVTNSLPNNIQNSIDEFLDEFGMRGFVEIDIGRERWSENPLHVIKTIKSYLSISDDQNPIKQHKKGIVSAYDSYNSLLLAVRKTKGGVLKSRILKGGFSRTRELAGLREYPKFTIIRIFWILKKLIIEVGTELASKGIIENSGDIFFLHYKELKNLQPYKNNNLKNLIKSRKELYNKEKLRKSLPRIIMSDGRTFYEVPTKENTSDKNIMIGSPVSPGIITGRARVVFNPTDHQLQPGEILVCPATDPSWTVLFLLASGLIMEVGGLMQHGSVVAREHNIPAVVGVNNATSLIKTGQLIRVNGSTGIVKILEK